MNKNPAIEMSPPKWVVKKLEDFAVLQRGFDLPIQNRKEGFYPIYGSNGINGFHAQAAVKAPGVLTGRSGSIGFVFYVDKDFWPLNTTLYVKNFYNNHPPFVKLVLESLELDRFAAATGVPSLNRNFVHPLPVKVPPFEQQVAIATVIARIDQAIEQTEALIAKQQRIKAGLMHDLLTKGIDEHGNIRSEATHEFKDSPLGRIPVEWEVAKLADIAQINRGKFAHRPRNEPRFYGGEFPFIQTGDVTNARGRVLTSYTQTLNAFGIRISKKFKQGTIVVTIAANIGDTAILGQDMYLTDSVVGIAVNEGMSSRFVELCLRRAKDNLSATAPQSAQKNINLETLKPLLLPLIEFDEQARIAQSYEVQLEAIMRNETSLTKLQATKNGLMQDLLTGKVPVTPLLEAQSHSVEA